MAGRADGPTFGTPGVANPYSLGAEIRTGPLQTFEPLFFYNVYEDEHIPWLATGFEYSDDFSTITVSLREGVQWSDGEPFTAEDVAFTFDLLLENAATAGDMRDAADVAERVAAANIIDPLTVEIVLTSPDPRFIFTHLTNHMAQGLYWLPEHIWSEVENPAAFRNFDPEAGLPVTTGAWALVESTSAQNVLERRDDWWGAEIGFRPLPQVETVIGVPFGSQDRAAQLLGTNGIDVSMDFGNPQLINTIKRINPNITTFGTSENGDPLGSADFWPTSLWFNHANPMWDDVRLRRAVALAVDRQQAIDVAYLGSRPSSLTPFPAFAPLLPAIEIAEAAAREAGNVGPDLETSASLMEEMGYVRNGDGLWELNGETLTATIQGVPPMNAIGPIIAQQLRNAGFDIEYVFTSDSRRLIRQGEAEMALFGHFGSVTDPAATLNIYHCDNALEVGRPTFSIARWCNEEYSAIVDQVYGLAPDDPQVLELVEAAMEIWNEEVVEVPISQWIHIIPMNQTYWTNWPSMENPYSSPAFWYESGQGAWLLHNLERAE
jgi:peptide/nickel transport system substrate-binding protein